MNDSSNANCDSDEGVDLPSRCYKCLYEWVVFSDLFVVDDVGKLVMVVGG